MSKLNVAVIEQSGLKARGYFYAGGTYKGDPGKRHMGGQTVSYTHAHVTGDAELTDISDSVAQLALQGPKAMEILRKVADEADIPEKYYSCKFDCTIDGMKCIISKTGYTGEDGVEIYLAAADAPKLWRLLMENGKDEGLSLIHI